MEEYLNAILITFKKVMSVVANSNLFIAFSCKKNSDQWGR